MPSFKASLTVDYSFCTATDGVIYDHVMSDDVVSIASSKQSTISDYDDEFKKKMAYYKLVLGNQKK